MATHVLIFSATFLVILTTVTAQASCTLEGGGSRKIVEVPENWPIGTILTRLDVFGDDIVLGPLDNQYVDLDGESRNLTLKQELDREEITSGDITVKVPCRIPDMPEWGLIYIDVIITILDVNDNPPIFEKSFYSAEVNELAPIGTTIIRNIRATDKDVNNWYIVYSLVDGEYSIERNDGTQQETVNVKDYFDIPLESEGTIRLKKTLDYETLQVMKITVMAEDVHNPGSSGIDPPKFNTTTTVQVNITDGDDQNPAFTDPPYIGTVFENASIGTPIQMDKPIHAFDQDFGINATVEYSIVNNMGTCVGDACFDDSDYFAIDKHTGEVSLNKVPLLRGTMFSILIQATQTNNKNHFDRSIARVIVQAANENAPKFLQSEYTVHLQENTPIGTSLINIAAIDNDIGSRLTYEFVNSQTVLDFRIENNNADIYTKRILNYEDIQEYNLHVKVSDGEKTDTALVKVQVGNINDNNPVFTKQVYHFYPKKENGALVGQVKAEDDDIDDSVSYSLGRNGSYFHINAADGNIYINGDPDNIDQAVYELSVVATDSWSPPRKAIAAVTVQFEPVTGRKIAASGRSQEDLILIIILGVICGILLILAILLIVYIYRRPPSKNTQAIRANSIERRLNVENSSSKNFTTNPEGLVYKPSESHLKLYNDIQINEGSSGQVNSLSTSTQVNPFETENNYIYGDSITSDDPEKIYSKQSRMMAPVSEIQYETAVAPVTEYEAAISPMSNSDIVLANGDSTHMNGSVTDSYVSTLESSYSTFNGGSTQRLVDSGSVNKRSGVSSFTDNSQMSVYDSKSSVDKSSTMQSTDKPGITVYF